MYQCQRAEKDFAMLEPMAFIVPPAVSQVSGTRDAVLDGKPGIMFPAGYDETYHTALSAGLSHIQEVSAYGENSPSSLAVQLRGGLLVAELIRQSDGE
jgi:hypothetical protein